MSRKPERRRQHTFAIVPFRRAMYLGSMFSIDHPNIIRHLRQLGYGLLPVYLHGKDRFVLVIKAPKEAILAARPNNEIRIYLLGDETGPHVAYWSGHSIL